MLHALNSPRSRRTAALWQAVAFPAVAVLAPAVAAAPARADEVAPGGDAQHIYVAGALSDAVVGLNVRPDGPR
ncbi:hypothetical protein [Nocardia harenae]|uniref:hypothetical protein n=1 Tax=Nocardia harenae TaxID=358707 RepID=UPI00082F7E77|nr:hypothetical protein [Nocardia harenae]